MGESLERQAGAGLGAGSWSSPACVASAWVSRASTAACWRDRGAGLPGDSSPECLDPFLRLPKTWSRVWLYLKGWAQTQVSDPAELPGCDFCGCVTIGLKWTRINNRVQRVCIVWRVINSLIPGDTCSFWCLPVFESQCLHLLPF